ncbi:MAG: hypothetical protein L6R40_003055 [Gallowayella cf. fulva]|nr:MAG: hypothetical protein L6R40_003055 [Xanthomendoza cf. fulva]
MAGLRLWLLSSSKDLELYNSLVHTHLFCQNFVFCLVLRGAGSVPRVPLLKQDGAHTRYVKGGVKPGRGSNDLRPPPLNIGETSIIDVLNEGPPPELDSPSSPFVTLQPSPGTPKKERVARKISGSIRKFFSPKEKSAESKPNILELQDAFWEPHISNTEGQELVNTSYGSDITLSSTNAEALERELVSSACSPIHPGAYGVASHQFLGKASSPHRHRHEHEMSGQQKTSSEKKTSSTAPSKRNRPSGWGDTGPMPSPRGLPSPVTAMPRSMSGEIYGQPPPEMVRPIIPHRITKEHLSLKNYPSVSREEIAQLPKEPEPTLVNSGNGDSPFLCSQPNSPHCKVMYNSNMFTNSTSAYRLRNSSEMPMHQMRSLPKLRCQPSMTFVKDGPRSPEDHLGCPMPEPKLDKNGRVKRYTEHDPTMKTLDLLAIEEILGRQGATGQSVAPNTIKPALAETKPVIITEQKLYGLNVSPHNSSQSSSEVRDLSPQTPTDFVDLHNNLPTVCFEDDKAFLEARGSYGLSSTSPYIHEDDASANHLPLDDQRCNAQPVTEPFTLSAPGRASYYRLHNGAESIANNIEPIANAASSMGKIQGYFHGCTTNIVIRDSCLAVLTKEPRYELLSRLRYVTGTETVYRKPGQRQPKHPNHMRRFHNKNLRCTDHAGHCGVCNTACCVYVEAIEASNEARTSHGRGFAYEVVRLISETGIAGTDPTTLLRCASCSRMTCPECIGICPVDATHAHGSHATGTTSSEGHEF